MLLLACCEHMRVVVGVLLLVLAVGGSERDTCACLVVEPAGSSFSYYCFEP